MMYKFCTDHDSKDRQMSWGKLAIIAVFPVPIWVGVMRDVIGLELVCSNQRRAALLVVG